MPAVVTTAAVSPEEDSSSANATEGSDGEGPADLIVKGLQEICPTREYCQRDSQSTPIVVKARVPDPEHKDRYILRDLDVWIKIHNIFVTMPEPFERLLLLFDEFARATSYWKEEVYDIVDVIGEPKEGGVPFTRTKIKHDWFVTAPTGWEFAINTWAKGGAKKPQALMEVHIMAEWHDDGIAGACEALQQAAGVVEKGLSFVPGGGTFGSVFGSFVGIGCQLGQALEEPAPTPSPC
ncbi:hypothetical protein Q8F55_008286 [Vanrija albida]|uniref:Uncharacterized protein n=1 Tax=Vanrija albida TaxID=181172 RepID=A0ABR3PW02_9TREE